MNFIHIEELFGWEGVFFPQRRSLSFFTRKRNTRKKKKSLEEKRSKWLMTFETGIRLLFFILQGFFNTSWDSQNYIVVSEMFLKDLRSDRAQHDLGSGLIWISPHSAVECSSSLSLSVCLVKCDFVISDLTESMDSLISDIAFWWFKLTMLDDWRICKNRTFPILMYNFDICSVFMLYFKTIGWKQRDLMKWNGKHNANERKSCFKELVLGGWSNIE